MNSPRLSSLILGVALVFASSFSGLAASVDQDKDLRKLSSEHFIIRYHRDVDTKYVYQVKNMAEKYYRYVTQEFNLIRDKLWLWKNRAKIFIAKDRDDYLTRFECPSWSGACVNRKEKLIYSYPDQKRFEAILVHELTHIIFREYVGEGKLPLWLDEGIATFMEDKYGGGHFVRSIPVIKKMIKEERYIKFDRLNTITIDDLNDQPKEFVDRFYLQSFSIIHFLREKYYRGGFNRFLFFLKRSTTVAEAISKTYFYLKNFEGMEKEWKKFYLE